MTRKCNYWTVTGQDNCMRCRQFLTDLRVNFVMGDLCQECFYKNTFSMWINDYDDAEYNVESYELMTGVQIDILENNKNLLTIFLNVKTGTDWRAGD